MKKGWDKKVRKFFAEIEKNKKTIVYSTGKFNLKVDPGVFPSNLFFESEWFAKNVSEIAKGKKFLEIGPGTGVTALFCAGKGAEVTVVDINAKAIKNTKDNFKNNGLALKTYCGSVYEPLPKNSKFDVIFWNHPFNYEKKEEKNVLLRSVFDFKYKNLEEYIANAHKHLNLKGKLLLGTGNIADIEKIEKISKKCGYKMKLLKQIKRPTEVDGDKINDYRLYQFVAQEK